MGNVARTRECCIPGRREASVSSACNNHVEHDGCGGQSRRWVNNAD